MRKIFKILLIISIVMASFMTASAGKIQRGIKSDVFSDNEFYVRSEKNKIYWGGALSVDEKLTDDIYSLWVAFYDNDRFISADTVMIDENLESFVFSEQTVRLSYEPEKLSAKAFAWSSSGMIPLSENIDAVCKNKYVYSVQGRVTSIDAVNKTVKFEILYSEDFEGQEITEPYIIDANYEDESLAEHQFEYICVSVEKNMDGYKIVDYLANSENAVMNLENSVDLMALEEYFEFALKSTDFKLLNDNGNVYLSANARVETVGDELYELRINVRNGNNTIFSDTINISSKFSEFNINQKLDIKAQDYLYMTVDFVYGNKKLTQTKEYDILGGISEVVGRVTEVNGDNAKFLIQNSDDFEGEEINATNSREIIINIGDTDISKHSYELITLNIAYKNGRYEVQSYSLNAKNKIAEFGSDEFYSYDEGTIKDTDGNIYNLADDYKVYINGQKVKASQVDNVIEQYVKTTNITKIKLLDAPKNIDDVCDLKYDYIMLDVYASMVVDEIYHESDETIIFLDWINADIVETSELILEKGKNFNIIDTEGNELSVEDIKPGNVITLYADFYNSDELSDSEFLDIVVSDVVISGEVIEGYPEKGEYRIGDNWYSFAIPDERLSVGREYQLYIDKFNKIVKYEAKVQPVNYGVINRVWENNSGEKVIRLATFDGEIMTYQFNKSADYDEWCEKYYNYEDGSFEEVYQEVIVSYKVNANGKIHSIESVDNANLIEGEFSKTGNKIMSAKMSDNTKILNYTKAYYGWGDSLSGKVYTTGLDYFRDGETYKIIYVGERNSDNTYPFVLILDGFDGISTNEPFAIVKEIGEISENGYVYTILNVIEDGVEKRLKTELDIRDCGISVGSVIVYHVDYSYGVVDDIYNLYNANDSIDLDDVEMFSDGKYAEISTDYASELYFAESGVEDWDDLQKNYNRARVGYGVITEKSAWDITIGKVNDGKTSVYDTIEFANDVNVYVYDKRKIANQLSVGTTENLSATKIASKFYVTDGEPVYRWRDAGKEAVKTVYFKTVDDEITDIIVIIPQ